MQSQISFCFVIFTHFIFSEFRADSSKIDSQLATAFKTHERVSVVVYFKTGIKKTLSKVARTRGGWRSDNRGPHIKSMIESLQENADSSQKGVLANVLTSTKRDEKGYKYFKRYPRSNLIYVKEASLATVEAIAADPQVAKIWEEPIIELVGSTEENNVERKLKDSGRLERSRNEDNFTTSILSIQVPEAWAELGGNRGKGVVVGHIDSGARYTHEALRDSFFGIKYGWYDPLTSKPEPYEAAPSAHGTNTVGIIAGSRGIGVAPGAKWISCLACNRSGCPYEALRDCINWMECPTLPDGSNPDCSKAPRVVNNSWASLRGVDVYNEDILRWREMGIIPVFAIGNRGPKCGTTTAPGELEFVIGVGGTGIMEWYDGGGAGPTPDGRIKPDLVAPAFALSAAHYWDEEYNTLRGTSQAAPCVTGTIALLMVRNPELTFEEAYAFLTENTEQTVTTPADKPWICQEDITVYPNNLAGHGRLNVLKVLQAQTRAMQKSNKNTTQSSSKNYVLINLKN